MLIRFDIPDPLLALLSALALSACAHYAEQRRNYIILVWCIPLLQIVAYYLLLSFGVEPFKSSLQARQAIFRPAFFGLLLGVVVFATNGRINSAIDSILHRVIERWRIFKRSSP